MSCGTTTLALSGSRTCSNATAIPRQVNSNSSNNYGSNYNRQPQPRCSTSTQVSAISATASPAEHSPRKVRCTTRPPLVDIPERKIQLTPCSYRIGYWMPFDAAKALAATFCWKIRYALTPLFGNEFPAMCISPNDRKNYGRMVIPPEIIRRATETATYYRSLEVRNSTVHPLTPSNRHLPSMTHHLLHGPERLTRTLEADGDGVLNLRLPPPKIPHHNYADSVASVASVSSARDSSMEPFCMSLKSTSPSSFTPINHPRTHADPHLQPKAIIAAICKAMHPDHAAEGISEDSDTDSDGSSNVYSTPNCPSMDGIMDIEKPGDIDGIPSDMDTRPSDSDDLTCSDEEWAEDDANDEDYRGPAVKREGDLSHSTKTVSRSSRPKKNPSRKTRALRPRSSPHFAHEVKAAEALLRLHKNELETSEIDIGLEDPGSPVGFVSRNGGNNHRKRRRASY